MLTNVRSDRVKSVRSLSRRSARERTGRFVVDGPQGVREAIRYAAERVDDLYVTSAGLERHDAIVQAALEAGVRVHETDEAVLTAMSETESPQGLLSVVATLTACGGASSDPAPADSASAGASSSATTSSAPAREVSADDVTDALTAAGLPADKTAKQYGCGLYAPEGCEELTTTSTVSSHRGRSASTNFPRHASVSAYTASAASLSGP